MTQSGWAEIALTIALVVALAAPLRRLIVLLYAGEPTFLSPALLRIETAFFRFAGVDPRREQSWLGCTL
ncbi:MAG: potassium-transporting ATPase subunit KdpA [Pseudomonadota bacterium]|nr:potassium-transporting ATPase subunit KdpA [Pseudomonadota bacterium]